MTPRFRHTAAKRVVGCLVALTSKDGIALECSTVSGSRSLSAALAIKIETLVRGGTPDWQLRIADSLRASPIQLGLLRQVRITQNTEFRRELDVFLNWLASRSSNALSAPPATSLLLISSDGRDYTAQMSSALTRATDEIHNADVVELEGHQKHTTPDARKVRKGHPSGNPSRDSLERDLLPRVTAAFKDGIQRELELMSTPADERMPDVRFEKKLAALNEFVVLAQAPLRQLVAVFLQELNRIDEKARTLGSLEKNKAFASSLQNLLTHCGLRLACPTCQRPGSFTCRAGTSPQGKFLFTHSIGSSRPTHGGWSRIPKLRLAEVEGT
jgi:hypothetical protein